MNPGKPIACLGNLEGPYRDSHPGEIPSPFEARGTLRNPENLTVSSGTLWKPQRSSGVLGIPLRFCALPPLDPPAALESGDTFTDRSPPGMARSNLNPRRTSLCWTPEQPSKVATVSQIAAGGNSLTDRSPPGMARSSMDPRRTSLCWTPQQPSKVATVSQIAAPQGWRGLI